MGRILNFFRKPFLEKVRGVLFRLYELDNRIFEWYYLFDFHGDIARKDLIADSKYSIENASDYHPYGNPVFRHLIAEALTINPNIKCFIDIGCGKGKQLIYAKRYFEFKTIHGIDFSSSLIEIAGYNIKQYGQNDITAACVDALDYRIPDEDALVFLFNPFNENILSIFLRNNIDHFRNFSSVIAYANDLHRDTLEDQGFKVNYRSQREKNSIYTYRKSLEPSKG